MKEDLFQELLQSIREGGAILRGEKPPSRSYPVEAPSVEAIREQYGLSQMRFAAMLGISVKTLRNWEKGRRTPQGAARVLLQVAAKHPEAILDAVHDSR